MLNLRYVTLLVLLALVGACSRSTTEPVVESQPDIPEWTEQKVEITTGDDPQSQYQQLVAEHEQAMQDFRSVYEGAATNEERQRIFDEKYPDHEAFAARFMEFAQQNRQTEAAKQALVWVIQYSQGNSLSAQAIGQLTQDHVEDSDMFSVCLDLSRANSTSQARTFLQVILAKNPNENVRGMACYSLAQQFKSLGNLKDMMADEQDRERLRQSIDPEELALIDQLDAAATDEQVIALLEQVKQEFANVELPSQRSLGDLADAELFEMQHLAIGKEAPDIEGEDADSETFKLSDYRGNIVLLDFWGDW